MHRQVPRRLFLISLLITNSLSNLAWAQASTSLRITIVEGDGAINNIRQRVNREPVVQVEDENRRPIAGAVVVFFLPDQGPSGTFVNGSKTLTVTTDDMGRASARGIRFNNQVGEMQMRVTASYQGLVASAVITQNNIAGPATAGAAAGGMSAGTKALITILVIGAAAGAGAGIYLGTHNGSSSPAPVPSIVLTPGTPTVGGPK
jgi:hypothetical protein